MTILSRMLLLIYIFEKVDEGINPQTSIHIRYIMRVFISTFNWHGLLVCAAQNNSRLFINAIFWIMRKGASWRNLPADLDGWKNT